MSAADSTTTAKYVGRDMHGNAVVHVQKDGEHYDELYSSVADAKRRAKVIREGAAQ